MVMVMAVARRASSSVVDLAESAWTGVVEVSVNSNLAEYDNIAKATGDGRLWLGWEREFMHSSSQNILK
jgi:hypothetical protein